MGSLLLQCSLSINNALVNNLDVPFKPTLIAIGMLATGYLSSAIQNTCGQNGKDNKKDWIQYRSCENSMIVRLERVDH